MQSSSVVLTGSRDESVAPFPKITMIGKDSTLYVASLRLQSNVLGENFRDLSWAQALKYKSSSDPPNQQDQAPDTTASDSTQTPLLQAK